MSLRFYADRAAAEKCAAAAKINNRIAALGNGRVHNHAGEITEVPDEIFGGLFKVIAP